MSSYVELFNLKKVFPTPAGPLVVVENFTVNMDEGQVVALIGHSGCGKSTVLSMVAGLTDTSDGGVVVARREVRGPGPDRGVVFQAPCLFPWLTALENVQLGVDASFSRETAVARRKRAREALELVGLASAEHKYPRELSRGMQQRVGIARALSLSPKMILLDEPFGMLDSMTRLELQDAMIALLESRRMTALMVTHDVDEALLMADRIVMMTTGPRAKVGDILELPFARPRRREDVLAHPEYYKAREHLLRFLETQEPEHAKPAPQQEAALVPLSAPAPS